MEELSSHLQSFYKEIEEHGHDARKIRPVPSEKIKEAENLLIGLDIPEQYRKDFYGSMISVLKCNEESYSNRKKVKELLDFSLGIKDLKINELTILFKGTKHSFGYVEGKLTLEHDDPYIEKISDIFIDHAKKNESALNSIYHFNEKEKRGPRPTSKVQTLKKYIPEINQVLSEIGLTAQKDRDEFIGRLLIIAGILHSEPPKQYKTMTAYFHSRIKQYLRPL